MDIGMDIKELEAFLYVVENRSFSKAAELLHLTQPTISSHISALERKLGIRLIVRTTKETYPSDAGKLLYGYAREILRLREEAVQALGDFSTQMRGTITIASSTILGQYYLPRLLQSFREKYPDISFNIQMEDSAEVVEHVVSRSAEVGFCGTHINAPKCLYHDFAEDRMIIIAPNEERYRAYLETGFPPAQLARETFISREKGCGAYQDAERTLAELGVQMSDIQTSVKVRSTQSITQMVSEGLGVAVVSQSAARDHCRFGKLLAFDLPKVTARRRLYIIKHKNNILSPIAQTFYDFAKKYYLP